MSKAANDHNCSPPVAQVDSHVANEKEMLAAENVDYTGTRAKTDPAEIALVRKLDFRIMVSNSCDSLFSLSSCFTLPVRADKKVPFPHCMLTSRTQTANPLLHVLPQLHRSQRLSFRATEWHREGLGDERL